MLCICRGMQVLNIVCGGTPHVHVPDTFGDGVPHRLPPKLQTRHPARLDADSRLARIVGTTSAEVCSWHHQALDTVGQQLVPVAWAADGVIEAVEHTAHPWCFGVQWHPEMQIEDAAQRRIFEALVKEAMR
jgi:putative glutamine amidotransferase